MKQHNGSIWTTIVATVAIVVFSLSSVFGRPAKKLRVVTSLPDLASIAQEVGGSHVETFSIAKGYQDPHFVDPKPSYMIKLQKADLFVQVGLDLEIGWVPPLLDGARNPNILPGGKGYVDASKGVPLLEIPVGDPTKLRAQGDIHVYGNPHYWLDPLRGKIIADNIYDGLVRLRPEFQADFERNLKQFKQKIDQKTAEWIKRLTPYEGTKIVAYHNSWPYFDERFGFDIVTFVEPKPGIPPTPKQLVSVIKTMLQNDVRVIIISPYYSKKSSELIASKTHAQIVELAGSVGGEPGIKTYFDLFDYDINKLIETFQKAGIQPHATE
ncbi:MAG: zinc ABC transporter substrate-binding protein [Calditrichaeota bacterium]|nr:MAG: zinc ABC transporter substrate-binding protein [Calditrichota bacterium]